MEGWLTCPQCNTRYKAFVGDCPNCGKSNRNGKSGSGRNKLTAIIGAVVVTAAAIGVYLTIGNPLNFVSPVDIGINSQNEPVVEGPSQNDELNQSSTVSNQGSSANTLEELRQYALKLINDDRQEAGLPPVSLSLNEAAQAHAEDVLKTRQISHWTTDGMKPYMRYSLYGGTGYVAQNIATVNAAGGEWIADYRVDLCQLNDTFCFKAEAEKAIKDAEYGMMYDDEDCCANGHKDNILDPYHTHVSLGIAYNSFDFAFVQNFENQYIAWQKPISYDEKADIVSMSGKLSEGTELGAISVFYDPAPTPSTYEENIDEPSYGLGPMIASVVEPAGPLFQYQEPKDVTLIEATKWRVSQYDFNNSFTLEKVTGEYGNGVYTIVIWGLDEDQHPFPITSTSVFRS